MMVKVKRILFFLIMLIIIPIKISAFNLGDSAILMEEETINTILKKSSKIDDLLKVYKSFPL